MAIAEFYANQIVFVTGVTGFLGKLIVEKLLRVCADVKKIYVLVRAKYDRSVEQRFKEIFESKCFDVVKKLNPNFLDKVLPLSGDCSEHMLGLNSESLEILKNEVTCVIHAAANIRFDIPLKNAIYNNARPVRDLLFLAKKMKNLKSFLYVSTAFSHCYENYIYEKFYDFQDPDEILQKLENLNDRQVDQQLKTFLGKWPNVYNFSKAVAESFVKKYGTNLPIAIVRPAIVVSTNDEPFEGWIDNFHGIVGVTVGVSLGVLRTFLLKKNALAAVVPADYVINSIIVAAANIESTKVESKNNEIKIYNFAPDINNILTWGDVLRLCFAHRFTLPLSQCIWYPDCVTSTSETVHKIRIFFQHTIFAYLADSVLFLIGKKPFAVKKFEKIHNLLNILAFFSMNSWKFETKNVEFLWNKLDDSDKKIFKFNMKVINWRELTHNVVVGGRVYLLKDPLHTIPTAKRRMYFLALLHYLFLGLTVYFCLFLFRKISTILL